MVEVRSEDLHRFVSQREPDIIQLHRVDSQQMAALSHLSTRTVPVFHNIELFLDKRTWSSLKCFVRTAPACIAVSETVRAYFSSRVQRSAEVIENGSRPVPRISPDQHASARTRISEALNTTITEEDILVVGLQRFNVQKNAAGLVDAFLKAAEENPRLRLVIAGAPNSWLEVRSADITRRRHPAGHRVHFLGDSDSSTLLAAADVFALDSFWEGGQVVAVEALAYGLPTVLSDVGFAREVTAVCGQNGFLVRRANKDYSQRAVAAQRRRFRQDNREEFVTALLAAADLERSTNAPLHPNRFTQAAMVARHAEVLRAALSSKST